MRDRKEKQVCDVLAIQIYWIESNIQNTTTYWLNLQTVQHLHKYVISFEFKRSLRGFILMLSIVPSITNFQFNTLSVVSLITIQSIHEGINFFIVSMLSNNSR